MTKAESKNQENAAEKLALEIGGVLAIILGLVPSDEVVRWDASKARFVVGDRLVSMETLREQLNRIEKFSGVRIRNLATKLERGEISLDQWRDQMQSVVGSSHILMAALGLGSIAAAVISRVVQSNIETEQRYVDKFAKDIPAKNLQIPTIKARAVSYLLAANVTFAVVHQAARVVAGYTEARRVRTAAESCPGCIAFAGRWIAIDAMPPIGSLACRSRCRCFMEYR